MMFTLWPVFSQTDANEAYRRSMRWFKENPNRRVARTDRGNVRRNHIVEDILAWCKPGVKLPLPMISKKPVKKAAKKTAKKQAKK